MKNSYCFLFVGVLSLSTLTLAKDIVPFQTTVSKENTPTVERYCDPAENAEVLSKIKSVQEKFNALDTSDPNRANLLLKIDRLNGKLKCGFRPIQEP